MARKVYVLDLSDEALAEEYERWHRPGNVPARVLQDILDAGNTLMEIYRTGDRLVMITETAGDVEPQDRTGSAESQAWEAQMDRFQKPVPSAAEGVKWQPAERIFTLAEHLRKDV